MPFLRRLLCALLCTPILLSLSPAVHCAEMPLTEAISGKEHLVSWEGIPDPFRLFDGNASYGITLRDTASLTFHEPQGIGSAYLIFDIEYGPYTVTDPVRDITCTFGEDLFLHQFLNLEEAFGYAPETVTFTFPSGDAQVNELTLFTPGAVPDNIQKWTPPKEGATDLMLFSAHGDDEQLFFAGLLPDYAAQRGYEVLVVYLTNHRNMNNLRCHEILNGLWSVGVTTYPVLGPFGDYFSKTRERAYALHQSHDQPEEALLGFVVEQLRRYRPQVAVGHDVNGEYGHGQHAMFSQLLCRGVEAAEDPAQYPELAASYGTWQVPKTYLHLWPENPITMDWDQPLSRFDGMTAFQVSIHRGFACHKSQAGGITHFITDYESAAAIPRYSPCEYGLYRTTVGPDTVKQDFFENLTSYHQQQVMAAFAKNQEACLSASQTSHTFAETRQHAMEEHQEAILLRRRAEALARQKRQFQRLVCLTVFGFLSAAVITVLIYKRGKKK